MDSSKEALARIAQERAAKKNPPKRRPLRLNRRQQVDVNLLAAVVGLSEQRSKAS